MESINLYDTNIKGVLDDKWIIIKKLGCGGTSSVYLGYDKLDKAQTLRAVKMINPKRQDLKYFTIEVEMLKRIDHPNVVTIIEGGEGNFKKNDGKSKYVNYIVLGLIKNGELFDFIFFPQKGFGEEFGKLIFKEILGGLEACHKAGVVHRDLKTENIMVTEDFSIKIADFGFAAYKEGRDGKGLLYTNLGTPSYAAPELHSKTPYFGISNDIFSIGVTLFVIVTGNMPFKQASLNDPFYSLVIKNDYEAYWMKRNLKVFLTDEFKSLFFNMIAYDYSQRPSIEEIRQHPWMVGNTLVTPDELKLEFSNRKQIVEYKRMKELRQKNEEKSMNKVSFTKAYRSSDNFVYEKECDRILEDYCESVCENRYVLIVIEKDPNVVFKYLKDFLYQINNRIEIKFNDDTFKMKVEIPLDVDPKNYDVNLINENNYLKFVIDLKLYQNDKLIVEFTKRHGDRLSFYELFEKFEKSFN